MKIFRQLKKFRLKNEVPHTSKEWQDAGVDFFVDVITIFLVVFLVIRPFVIAPFQVKQQSMEPNVHDSEYILVDKLPYNSIIGWSKYQRDDIVVFRPPTNEGTYLIKRVIGLPGETLRITGGYTWRKDPTTGEFVQLDEPFLSRRNSDNTCVENSCTTADKREIYDFVVPPGHYFVLGDNRIASRDARSCFVGRCTDEAGHYITDKDIEGKAWVVFFPIRQVRSLSF